MAFLTEKKATSSTPQVVTLIIDDSGSMEGSKAHQATAAVQDMVITLQSGTLGASWARFVLNIARFGDGVTTLALAAMPSEIDVGSLSFEGRSGQTEMANALEWGAQAVQKALERCRREAPHYEEDKAPSPLCVFFSDGANTGRDVTAAAKMLKAIPFKGGAVDVVACGIEVDPSSFAVMQSIASRPDLAVNIDPASLGDFIAAVGATVVKGENPRVLTEKQWQA
jgi:uncharacterized protein YegL